MPVRDKALGVAFQVLMGDTPFHFRNQPGNERAVIGEEDMSRDEFNKRFWHPLERIFERVVDSIDWNRVMLEAASRHMALEGKPDHEKCEKFVTDHLFVDGIDSLAFGPDCLCEALMSDDTFTNWEDNPKAPRYHK